MADSSKKPENSKDMNAKGKNPSKPSKDLEIPARDNPSEDEILEILEVVEDEQPTVDEEVEEISEVVEVVEDEEADLEVSEVVEFGSEITKAQPIGESFDDDEPVLVELASDIDLSRLTDDLEGRPEPSDIISEALDSGIDLGESKEEKSAKAAKSSSDSDIDLGAMLDESDQSSAVNLGGSGEKKALPASDAVETRRHSDEALVVNDNLLVGAPGAVRDDALLVTPKKKSVSTAEDDLEAEFAAELGSASDHKTKDVDEVIPVDADEAVAEAIDDDAILSQSPQRGKKGREPELVGAGPGSGRRRGGFMPFLFGGLIATVLLGGGAAAAWYFDMLPKSPTAQQQPSPRKFVPTQPQPNEKGDEELDALRKQNDDANAQLTALRKALEAAKVPAEPDKLEAHLKNLAVAKPDPVEIKPPPANDKLNAIIAERDAANKQLEQLKAEKAAADKAVSDLNAETASAQKAIAALNAEKASAHKTIDKLQAENESNKNAAAKFKSDLDSLAAGDKNGLMQQRDVALKERDETKKALENAINQQKNLADSQKAAEQALSTVQKDLAEASKAREAIQSAYDSAKAELEKARAGSPAPIVTDVSIAESLIKQADPKAQGQGYIILGASQTRAGKASEGMSNILKGLKMVDPQLAMQASEKSTTKQPSSIISKAPVMPPVETAPPANPLAAEKFYTKGLELFWARSYGAAETQFTKAVGSYNDDARYYYFLGLSRYLQGSTDKRRQAHLDFVQGVQLENSHHPAASEINASLERIQGDLRSLLNAYRERQPLSSVDQ